jgi:hypothetical protein
MATIRVKVEHNAIYWVSIILTVLFAWLIFPIKWWRKLRFRIRKHFAFRDAQRASKQTNANVYVCQWGNQFFVGRREVLRQKVDKIGNKVVRMHTKSHVYDVDFRKSLVAKFHRGVQIEMSDK